MAAWTTPRTWTTAELVTASIANVHWRDNLQFLYDNGGLFRGFRAYLNATQSVATATWTKVAAAVEGWDTAGEYDTSTYRHTPTRAGKWLYHGVVGIPSTTGRNVAAIYKGGSAAIKGVMSQAGAGVDASQTVADVLDMNGTTDYAELYVRHEAGVSRNLDQGTALTAFSGVFLGA